MILKGVLLHEKTDTFKGKNGNFTVRTLKVRDTLKSGDERHVFVKVYGDNTIKTEIGKVVEIEFYDSVRTNKEGRTFINKVAA